ncbi:MAG: hypothetical protein ACTSWW_10990, partial [Promethearchaeota archaeon]
VGDVFAILAYLMMGEPVPQKFLEFQEAEQAPTQVVETPPTPLPIPELSQKPAVINENLHIPPPPKTKTSPLSSSRPSLHAPIVRIPSDFTTTQKISEPEWFAPKVSPRPSPLSTISAPQPQIKPQLQPQIKPQLHPQIIPQNQPQIKSQLQPQIIPRQEPMIIKPKPIPKKLPVVPMTPSLPRKAIIDPPISSSIPLPPVSHSSPTLAPKVPPKPKILPSKPSNSSQNPFLIQNEESSLPKPVASVTPLKSTKGEGAKFTNFLNTLQKSPPSENKSASLFAKPDPQIIRPTSSSGFLNKKKKSSLPPIQQQASWISNLDSPEKKPNGQKNQLDTFIRDSQPPRPPAPKGSTRSLFVDNITRDKPIEVKPSQEKPTSLFFQQPTKSPLKTPTQSKIAPSVDNKTHDCPRCGATLNKKFRFCNKCGSRID